MLYVIALLMPVVFAAPQRFVSVSGQCSKQVAPDRGSVTLTAESKEATAAEATQKVTKLYDKLRAEVKKLALKDLQLETSNFNVYPEHDYPKGKQRLIGYRASMGISIETSEIAKLGEAIELGGKLGIQNAHSLTTYLSVEKRREAQESCLEEAIKNARLKAERMAKAGSAQLGEVISIEEFRGMGSSPRPPVMYAAKSLSSESADMASTAPTVDAKTQTIEVSVSVGYALK